MTRVELMTSTPIESTHQTHDQEILQTDSDLSSKLNNNDFEKSSMFVKDASSSSSPLRFSSRTKQFIVYLNGAVGSGQDVTVELDQIFDWNDFVLELDSGITFSAPTNEIFSLTGEKLASIDEVLKHEFLVVGAGQPFISLSYKSNAGKESSSFSKNLQLRTSSPLVSARKFLRTGLAKSVYAIDDSIQGPSSNTELSSLLKTMSEEQVCFRDASKTSSRVHCQLPNSVVRQTLHSKPRPVSCYGTQSVYSNEIFPKRNQNVSSSRIPKRIVPVVSPGVLSNVSSPISPATPIVSVVQSFSSPVKVPQINTKASGCNSKTNAFTKGLSRKEKNSKQDPNAMRNFILPRIVSVIRTGTKPRKVIRYLLNQRTAKSFEQVLSDMTERLQSPWGAIRKVFTISGLPVETLQDFFREEKIFLACPNDRHVLDDFTLDSEEVKAIPNCLKLYPGAAAKGKSSDAPKTPQRRLKSMSPRINQRTPPTSYPTHPKFLAVAELPNHILNKYFVGDIIGDGNFAVVRQCVDRISGAKYALKVIDKMKSGLDGPPDHEVKILKSVTHPNIIHLYEDFDFKNEIFVVMEYVSGGDLFDLIAQCVKFSEEESVCFTRDIASSLSFLHSRGIVHRDIKPENLLVFLEADKQRRIKVGDFGLAHYIEDDIPLYTVCGTPTYVAPEILAETGYGYKVDVWAMGIILYILLCGYPPFSSSSGEQADLFDLILVGDYDFPQEQWDEISEDAKDLIMKMIESDVDIRLSADEVLDHPWLCSNSEEAEAKRSNLSRKDFRFNVFEQMGLTKLGFLNSSSSTTTSTSFELSNSS